MTNEVQTENVQSLRHMKISKSSESFKNFVESNNQSVWNNYNKLSETSLESEIKNNLESDVFSNEMIHRFDSIMPIQNRVDGKIPVSLPSALENVKTKEAFDSIINKYDDKDEYLYVPLASTALLLQKLVKKEQYDQAIAVGIILAKEYPTFHFTYALLGDAYYETNQKEKAIENYKKHIELNHQNNFNIKRWYNKAQRRISE